MPKTIVWKNHIQEQIAYPLSKITVHGEQSLPVLVKDAIKKKSRIKAVGSGHSWSDVCLTTGNIVLPNKLNKELTLDTSVLKTTDKIQ